MDIKGRKASFMSKSLQKVGKPGDIKEDLDIKGGKEESMSKTSKKTVNFLLSVNIITVYEKFFED